MTTRRITAGLLLSLSIVLLAVASGSGNRWTEAELAELRSMSLRELPPLPVDATNRVGGDTRAAAFGKRLFEDTRLSSNGKVSCATCHQADRHFQDGVALAKGVGTTNRRTMPIAGTAYSPFLFWDGRKDSLWAQALGPLESPVEHGGSRAQYAHVVNRHYRAEYEAIFGPMPDLSAIPENAGPVEDPAAAAAWRSLARSQQAAVTEIFVNIGKAIAAFERGIQHRPSRFDAFVDQLVDTGREQEGILSDDEIAGLRLFIGKGNCTQCHNGPLLTNNEFHNTGVPSAPMLPRDSGRSVGAAAVLADEFNCRSPWSDAAPGQCKELDYMNADGHELERAFKVPSLRDVAVRAPYMHAGQFSTLGEVLAHYNRAPKAPAGHTELKPLKLKDRELRLMEAFLKTLSGE